MQVHPVAWQVPPSSGVFSLPSPGGTLSRVGLLGTVTCSGGVRFTHAGKTMTASNFVLNTVRSTLFATVRASQIPLLAVDLTHLVRTSSGREIIASGITSTWIPSAAALLNGKLATTHLHPGNADRHAHRLPDRQTL